MEMRRELVLTNNLLHAGIWLFLSPVLINPNVFNKHSLMEKCFSLYSLQGQQNSDLLPPGGQWRFYLMLRPAGCYHSCYLSAVI